MTLHERILITLTLSIAGISPCSWLFADDSTAGADAVGPPLVNSLAMRFMLVPPGEWIMGQPDLGIGRTLAREHQPRLVRLTRGYYLSAYEVTQAEYFAVTGRRPSYHGSGLERATAEQFPVENVNWSEARRWCKQLSSHPQEIVAGRSYRLPTEAEWEYACRGGCSTRYDFSTITERQQATGENGGHQLVGLPIGPVGRFAPNRWGLFDLRGNVFEWCNDWYAPPSTRVALISENPQGPRAGVFKIFRGSDWVYAGDGCQLSRHPTEPTARNHFIGFRVVCELKYTEQFPNKDAR